MRNTIITTSTLLVPGLALAVPPDFTPLVSAVDLSTVVSSILAIAVLLAGVQVARKGARLVLGFLR